MTEGIVLRAISGMYSVHADGHIIHCSLRGNLKKDLQYSTSQSYARRVTRARRHQVNDPLAVGDRVRVVESHHGSGVIEEVLPRTSRFCRSGFRGRERTLVCNLDQVLIVFACAEPNPDPWKLDRFLVAAEAEEIGAIIVANKVDLAPDGAVPEALASYQAIGYRVCATAAKADVGALEIRGLLTDKVSAFVGPSGVGKSSILNAVQPGLNLRTTEVGGITFKGRHTTTAAQLVPLWFGGWVADTPGLRQFDLVDLSREEIADCFPEFRPVPGECRFDDCRHDSEPGCKLKAAIDSGAVTRRRYESFLVMAAEADARHA